MTYSLAMRFVALALAFALACQQQPQPAAAASKLELVDAPPTPAGGTAATWIAGEVTRAQHDGKQLVVYVGASWCEPCQQFHHAVEKGELDELLTGVNILEFDLDADRDALAKDGYSSELIPLFVSPENDGKASPRRIWLPQGSERISRSMLATTRTLFGAIGASSSS